MLATTTIVGIVIGVVLVIIVIVVIAVLIKNPEEKEKHPFGTNTLWPHTDQVVELQSKPAKLTFTPNPNMQLSFTLRDHLLDVAQGESIKQPLFHPLENSTMSGALFTSSNQWMYVTFEATSNTTANVIVSEGLTSSTTKQTTFVSNNAGELEKDTIYIYNENEIAIATLDLFFVLHTRTFASTKISSFTRNSNGDWVRALVASFSGDAPYLSVVEENGSVLLMAGGSPPHLYFYDGITWSDYPVPFLEPERQSRSHNIMKLDSGDLVLVCQLEESSGAHNFTSMYLANFPTNHDRWTQGALLDVGFNNSKVSYHLWYQQDCYLLHYGRINFSVCG